MDRQRAGSADPSGRRDRHGRGRGWGDPAGGHRRGKVASLLPSPDDVRSLLAGRSLLGRFGYLVLTQATVIGLGLGYWAVTTRYVVASDVGLAAAAVSAATFVSALAVLGIGSLVLVELNRASEEDRQSILVAGVTVAAVSALICALILWALTPVLGQSLRHLGRVPLDAGLFVAGTVLTTLCSVLDSAAIGIHRSRVQWMRNTVASALRVGVVAVLVAMGHTSTSILLEAWVASTAVSVLCSAGAFGLIERPSALIRRWRTDLVRRYAALALRHHVLNLSITSVGFFLPVLAALLLVPTTYAYFAVAFMMSSAVLLVPALLAMTLFAEATGDENLLRYHIRRTLPIGFACCGLLLAVFEPSASLVLGIFGHSYAIHGATTLRILLVSGIPYVVKDHWVSIRRAQRRLSEAAWVVALGTITEAAAATAGAVLYGTTGLVGFWVAATFVEALFYAPGVYRVWHVPSGGARRTMTVSGRDGSRSYAGIDLWSAPEGRPGRRAAPVVLNGEGLGPAAGGARDEWWW